MDERNIVAAILAGNLATQVREKGNSFAVAAEHAVMMYDAILAVMMYDAILKELTKANLPPLESAVAEAAAPKPRARAS